MSKYLLILILLIICCISCVRADITTIESVRQMSPGNQVKICGIIINGNELGTIRFMQDSTAGIAVFSNLLSETNAGDLICVQGSLSAFNDLLQISPVNSIEILEKNGPLPPTAKLSFKQAFSGEFESQLVQIPSIYFKSSGLFSANQNYKIYHDSLEGEIRIYKDTDLAFTSIPVDTLLISGIMSRYRNTLQLIPLSINDLESVNGPFIINKAEVIETLPAKIELEFNTRRPGQTIFRYGKTLSFEKGMLVKTNLVKDHSMGISSLEPATFYFVQAMSVDENSDTSRSVIRYLSTASLSSGEIKVYFNNETDHSVANWTKSVNIDRSIPDTVVAYIKRATESIDWAVYNFNNKNLSINISDALNEAYHNGVRVRIIANGNTANLGLNELHPGIPVLKSPDDHDHTIMHHKFILFDVNAKDPDRSIVWTGSTNFTEFQINRDPNHVIILNDQSLARAYLIEFEEMWGSSEESPNPANSRFGAFKNTLTPELFNIGGKKVRLFFSPPQPTQLNILKNIYQAEQEIYTAVFAFTRTEIARSLIDKHYEGIFVSCLFDNDLSSNKAVFDMLKENIDSTVLIYDGKGTLHHKYMITDPNFKGDHTAVLTGSYNWSSSAENSNDENTLIIYDIDIAGQFYQEWVKRYKESGGVKFYSTGMGMKIKNKNDDIQLINNIVSGYEPKIFLTGIFSSELNLKLTDLNGKNIFSETFNKAELIDTLEVALPHHLNNGVYVLMIKNENQLMIEKLVRIFSRH